MINEAYLDSFGATSFEDIDDMIYDRDESYGSCKLCGGEVVFNQELDADFCIECGRMQ